MTAGFKERIRTNTPVTGIRRFGDRAEVTERGGAKASYDQVVLAVHSDQAVAMLADTTPAEREILGPYPTRRTTRSCTPTPASCPNGNGSGPDWNYLIPKETQDRAS